VTHQTTIRILSRKNNQPIKFVPVGCGYVSQTTGLTRIRLSRDEWGTMGSDGLVRVRGLSDPVAVADALRMGRRSARTPED